MRAYLSDQLGKFTASDFQPTEAWRCSMRRARWSIVGLFFVAFVGRFFGIERLNGLLLERVAPFTWNFVGGPILLLFCVAFMAPEDEYLTSRSFESLKWLFRLGVTMYGVLLGSFVAEFVLFIISGNSVTLGKVAYFVVLGTLAFWLFYQVLLWVGYMRNIVDKDGRILHVLARLDFRVRLFPAMLVAFMIAIQAWEAGKGIFDSILSQLLSIIG